MRGASIQDLRARLSNKNNTSESKEQLVSETKSQIPEDLVQIQVIYDGRKQENIIIRQISNL